MCITITEPDFPLSTFVDPATLVSLQGVARPGPLLQCPCLVFLPDEILHVAHARVLHTNTCLPACLRSAACEMQSTNTTRARVRA